MAQALRLNVHPRAIQLAQIIERGERSFDELHIRDKMILYDCPLDLDGLVTTEELLLFKVELAKRGELPLKERVRAHAQLVANNGKQKLGIQQ